MDEIVRAKEIIVGAGSTVFKVNKEGVFAGADNYTDAPFSLSFTGVLKANTGTFAGTLSAAAGTLGAITIGSNAWHVDSSGNMWWGSSSTYAGATIKISAAGALYCNSGTFSGSITGATGTFSGSLSGATITGATGTFSGSITGASGTFSGDLTGATGAFAGTVAAGNITAGTITGVTITGATIQTRATGTRVLMTSDDRIYFKNGDTTKGALYVLSNDEFWLESSGGTTKIYGGGVGYYFAADSFAPNSNNAYYCGLPTLAWVEVNSYSYVDKCLWLDEEDDLAILKACQPKKDAGGEIIRDENGKARLDHTSLPQWLTNEVSFKSAAKAAKERAEESLRKVEEEIETRSDPKKLLKDLKKDREGYKKEIEDATYTNEEVKEKMGRNLGNFMDVIAGAVRQLSDKLDNLEKKL